MKPSIFPALSLATLMLACAHDPANRHATTTANAEPRAGVNESAENARELEATPGAEGVGAPQQRGDGDRLASADTALPVEARGSASDQNAGHAPNNTGVNERDRNNAQVTPMQQGNGEVDLDLTQRIRKAVMADDSLSFTAKNTKIITRDGRVTLRGPVKSAAEKDAIYKCAVSAAGVGHVSNELEVETK